MSQQLRALEGAFIDHAQRSCSELGELLRLLTSTPDAGARLSELARLSHDLAGTAGTYGYLRVTEHARRLSEEAQNFLSEGRVPRPEDLNAWLRLAEAIRVSFTLSPPKLEVPPTSSQRVAALREPEERVTVLCVEDQSEQVSWLSTLLEYHGYEFVHCARAADFEESFHNCSPDLILMDVDLPDGTGLELARSLRNQSAGFAVPIVFLTGESHPSARLRALSAGADDFLTKPVDATLLLCAIEGRAQRAKLTQTRMAHDGLTGLLNRATFVDRAMSAVSRLRRTPHAQASLVLIDLDHFKSINDRFGHARGDAVLRALSHRIQSNVRRSDHAGRIGGEEFALLLEDAPPAAAKHIIERLLSEFAATPVDGVAQRTTFSAGIASFTAGHRDFTDWLEEADAALYRAKAAGRECVVLAEADTSIR